MSDLRIAVRVDGDERAAEHGDEERTEANNSCRCFSSSSA